MMIRPSANAAATRPVRTTEAGEARFIVRQEYFGAAVYDRAGVGTAAYLQPEAYAWLDALARGEVLWPPDTPFAEETHQFGLVSATGALDYEVWPAQEPLPQLPEARIQTSFDIITPREVKPAADLDLNTCAAGIVGCNINSRGEFAACAFLVEMDRAFNWGNIRDTGYSVLPFWRRDTRLHTFRQHSIAKARDCLACEYYRHRCQGTCVVQAYWRDLAPGRFGPYCLKEVEGDRRAANPEKGRRKKNSPG